jgi:amidophosphoribosyltransferase
MNNENDKVHEKCALMAISAHPAAAHLIYLGLHALQHRGQESAGIISFDRENNIFHKHVAMGLVADVFRYVENLNRLKGSCAIGHTRYSTTGATQLINAQPLLVTSGLGPMAIAHNGNFTNSGTLRRELEAQGSIFQTTTDTEIVFHLIAKSTKTDFVDKIKEAFSIIKGAYCIVLLAQGKLYAIRDPNGFRPLCLGKKENAFVIASESCALDIMDAEYIREIEAGEVLTIDENGINSTWLTEKADRTACIFEFIYFARPDSRIFGEKVDKARRKMGKILALEGPADADIVISVPDSSNTAALGFSQESGIRFELGLIRNHYIGRTFIHPDQTMRDFNVRIKYNPVRGVLNNKRVIVVEDSIVRGTTLRKLTGLIRNAGAKEVHIRVTAPPILFPCYYGMDFPTKEELIASTRSVKQIQEYLEVESLHYLSLPGLMNAVSHERGGYCTACFSGNYPLPIEQKFKKHQLANGIAVD